MLTTPTISLKSTGGNTAGIDIDDFNEIEQRFNALQKQLEELYGHVLFGLHTLDASGVFLSINAQELTWLGYTQQEVIGTLKFIDFLNTESREMYMRHLQTTLLTGVAEDIELELITKSNAIKNITLYTTPVFNTEGVLTKYRAVLFNIDKRKSMEAQLAIAATTFESQQGIMVTDANGVIQRVNRAYTKITGYSVDSMIGQMPRFLVPANQENASYNDIWQTIKKKGSWEGEILSRRKSGDLYPEHITVTAVKDRQNSVINYVATFTDESLSWAASDELSNPQFYDALTRLPNRKLLLERLSQALILSARSGQQGALLFLNLDHFKTLNDTLGYKVGDLLLEQVAMRLIDSVREGDIVARIGGDEFAVLLEGLSEHPMEAVAQTNEIAEKIMATMNHNFILNTYTYCGTYSIGITLFNGHQLVLDDILRQADIAMYQSKNEGRNSVRFFDPKIQDALNQRVDLERQLRKAIDQQQFELYYQIQVDNLGGLIGAEALVRWIHPVRGMITPVNFISLAEETGQILAIGKWVLDQACIQLNAWQQSEATKDIVLAVNVSAFQFNQTDFVEQVLATIEHHKIHPNRLKLELTESMLIKNIDEIIIKMEALSRVGIQFSLDDFGTGYSSLQYLKKLPLNQLKIDQSFVRDIVTDSNDRAIVRTIISIAHSLDINVLAEGVETSEQRQYLLDNGCTQYQGYLFGKPLPINDFETFFIKR